MLEKILESRLTTVMALISIVSLVFSLGVAVGSDRDQLRQIQQNVRTVEKRQEDADKGLRDAVKGLNEAVLKLTESVARLEGRLAEKR